VQVHQVVSNRYAPKNAEQGSSTTKGGAGKLVDADGGGGEAEALVVIRAEPVGVDVGDAHYCALVIEIRDARSDLA